MARKKDATAEPPPAEGVPEQNPAPETFGEGEGFEQPVTPSLDAMGPVGADAPPAEAPPGPQGALPGVATPEEVNRTHLKDSELKAAGKMLTKAKAALDQARDGMLDMVSCGSEAPETLEKAAQLLKGAIDLVKDAHDRIRGAEV